MSGLLGLVDLSGAPVEPELLRSLAEASAYRAPGGITCQILEGAGLAHFALHAADRPLFTSRISVLFDGRLDNREELIARLVKDPESLDAELVLAAYLEWGDGCPERLLGDFALAIWDAPRRRLLCAVDPLGMKPLHWARAGSGLCFASDAVMVLRHPAVPDGYDEMEIGAYLAGRCESTERSFFPAVHKLAPGHLLAAEGRQVRVRRYWSPSPGEIRYPRDEDYANHLREILERSVADRLRGAGDCAGVAMSGGLDSTSVAALALRASGGDARAYTFVFDRLAQCDERSYSQAMTEELGLETEAVHAEELWRLESGEAVPFSPDTPFLGWRTCYQEILRRLGARGSRVLLLGHGGDDLLRGSSLVYAERLRRGDLGTVREVFHYAADRREPWARTFYRLLGRPFLPAAADRLLRSAVGIGSSNSLPPWLQPSFARRIDLSGTPGDRPSSSRRAMSDNLLAKPWYWRLVNWHERTAAALGFEVRHPFLDRRLLEFVLTIPGEQLFRLDRSKNLLRRAMAGILPERIRNRKRKTSFTPFLGSMVWDRASEEVKELLRAPLAADLGFVDGGKLRSAYLEFPERGTDESRRALWCAITLEIWLRRREVIREARSSVLKASPAAA
jgi:asparagine synthase (glutamine-hydrolysing)